MARKEYPSDFRRYFRIISQGVAKDTAELTDAEFRAFWLLLAYANENRAQRSQDWIQVARSQLVVLYPNRRGSVATAARVVRELCGKQAFELHEGDAVWAIHVRNWSQIQGYTPSGLRPGSVETPSNTNTNSFTEPPPASLATPSQREGTKGWINLLSGDVPTGLSGQTWATAAEWFDYHYDILDAEAEGNARTKAARANGKGDSTGWQEQYNAAFKSVLHRYWKNKMPRIRRRAAPTTTKGVTGWEN